MLQISVVYLVLLLSRDCSGQKRTPLLSLVDVSTLIPGTSEQFTLLVRAILQRRLRLQRDGEISLDPMGRVQYNHMNPSEGRTFLGFSKER